MVHLGWHRGLEKKHSDTWGHGHLWFYESQKRRNLQRRSQMFLLLISIYMPYKAESTAKITHTLEGGWAGFHQESFDAHKAEILLELDKNHKNICFWNVSSDCCEFGKLCWFTTWWLCFCWSETGLKVEWCQKPPRVGISDSPDLKTSKWLQNTDQTVPKAYTLQVFIIQCGLFKQHLS